MRTICPLTVSDAERPVLFSRLMDGLMIDEGRVDPCWIASGWDDGKGYKKIKFNGRGVYRHRAMYTVTIGEIPAGLVLDHKCKNRACCNPQHLEPVTVVENTARGDGAWMLEQGKYPK